MCIRSASRALRHSSARGCLGIQALALRALPYMAPQYGKWATETSVSDLLTGTLGAAPFVDEEEKTRIAALSKLLQDPKKSRCEDFSDLCTITLPEWDLHIRQAGWPLDEVHAVRRQLFKYMGERGAPHVPPSAAAIPGAPYRPLCCAHTKKEI